MNDIQVTRPRPRPRSGWRAAGDGLNFLVTNRIPRNALTRCVGWLSKIENPLVRDLSIGVWRLFSDVDLSDARTTRFRSMHDCFTRELRDGARAIDGRRDVLASPCDGIVGAHGRIVGGMLLQAKGMNYGLSELLADDVALAERFRDGYYVTLRLTSGMYHRFHAPHDLRVRQVTYVSGEAYNVNPPALQRIAGLFCRNERAILECRLDDSGHTIALVPVAAVLVASIRLHFLDVRLHLRYRGKNRIDCDQLLHKGDEMGWFEHGSTIIVLAPRGSRTCPGIVAGSRIKAGMALLSFAPSQAMR